MSVCSSFVVCSCVGCDHLSVLKYEESPLCRRLLQRMEASPDRDFATTIVCVEEQVRGTTRFVTCTIATSSGGNKSALAKRAIVASSELAADNRPITNR